MPSGKITYRGGRHPSRSGEWVADTALVLAADLEPFRGLIEAFYYLARLQPEQHTPLRDVRATLSAMTRIDSDADAVVALAHCDETSHAYLYAQADLPTTHAGAAWLRLAASTALQQLDHQSRDKGGRNSIAYKSMLAREVLRIWMQRTGDASPACWADADGMTPLVEFALPFYRAVALEGLTVPATNVAKTLREELQRRPEDPPLDLNKFMSGRSSG